MHPRSHLPVLFAAAMAPAAGAGLPVYVVHDLGTIAVEASNFEPGSRAWGVGAGGQVVGASVTDGEQRNVHAFRWLDGEMIDLGVAAGDAHSIGFAVGPAGDVVGVSFVLGALAPHGVRWSPDGSITLLGPFTARAINGAGTIVGDRPVPGAVGTSHAVRWFNGTLADLGTLGGSHSAAVDINESGWIVGQSLLSDGVTTRGVLWLNGGTTALPTLGGTDSHATAVNDAGVVVGVAETAAGIPRATRWLFSDQGALLATEDLGAVADAVGPPTSAALAINGAGVVVGTSDDRAVRFDGGTATDLNGLIAPGTGWSLRRADAIDHAGRIAGQGLHHGRWRAFLLVLRAPADLDADGTVDGADLGLLLSAWGQGSDYDLDGDGIVGGADLGLLLAAWG